MAKAQNKQAESEFFDRFGDEAAGFDSLSERSYQKILSCVDRFTHPRPGELLVDLGCGSGAFTLRLHRVYPENPTIGVDISTNCIRKASTLAPKVRFMVGDIETTPLESNSVDVLFFFGVLHHFPDFRRVAQEAYRLLKPGGRFFSYDPHHYNPALWLYRSDYSPIKTKVGVTANERLLKAREVRDVFSQAGFSTRTLVMSGVTSGWTENPFVRRYVLPVYNVFDKFLEITPLGRVLGSAVIGWGTKD